jgi:hypothetical protein
MVFKHIHISKEQLQLQNLKNLPKKREVLELQRNLVCPAKGNIKGVLCWSTGSHSMKGQKEGNKSPIN